MVGGGGSGRMTSEQFCFCCYNKSACAVQIFFYSNFFSEGEGGENWVYMCFTTTDNFC